jgi:hypothetical protein
MRMRHFLQLLDPQSHPHRTPPAAAAAPTKDTDMHPGAVQETFYIEYLALHQYLGQVQCSAALRHVLSFRLPPLF